MGKRLVFGGWSGTLITFEGNEGCGKSTQIKLLYAYLKKQGRRVFLTREPGGTRVGDAIREVLLDNKNKSLTAVSETLLYMASRAQLVTEVILPQLKKGNIVLCDRWSDATIAYQGFAGGVDPDWIRGLAGQATQGIAPDLSLFLALPLKVGLRRAVSHKKADRMERKKFLYHQKVRQGYEWIAKKEPQRFRRIPIGSSETIAQVHEKIKAEVMRVLEK